MAGWRDGGMAGWRDGGMLNGWFQFSSYTCSSDNIFIKARVFPCKYEKINSDDEAFVRTAKIG